MVSFIYFLRLRSLATELIAFGFSTDTTTRKPLLHFVCLPFVSCKDAPTKNTKVTCKNELKFGFMLHAKKII